MAKKLSGEDLEAARLAFGLFDKNGDGKISPDELQNLLAQLDLKLSLDQIKIFIYVVDTDENGNIDFNEFVTMMEGDLDDKKIMERLFKDLDKDHDGFIDRTEFEAAAKIFDESDPAEIEKDFKKADSDNDGKINFEEFLASVNE